MLLPTAEGGRRTPMFSGIRPIHRLHDNYLTSGQHEFIGTSQLAPGETTQSAVWLVTPDVYPESLWVGRTIDVMEGTKVVGKLTITKILNPVLCGSPERYSPLWVQPENLDAHGKRIDG